MDVLLRALLAYGGLVIGLLVMARTAYWFSAVGQAVASGRGSSGRTALGLMAVLLLHSGPWFIVGTAIFAYVVLSSLHRSDWVWFFSGVLAAPLINAAILFRVWQATRKRRSAVKPLKADEGKGA